jgi:hypothetical protein
VNDERTADAVDHLQAAALELIEAARAFLDVVEELVSDRERLTDISEAVGEVALAATRLVRPDRAAESASAGGSGAADADRGGPGSAAPRTGTPVERIPVS